MTKTLNIWSPRPDAEPLERLTPNLTVYGLPLISITPRRLTDQDIARLVTADRLIFTSRYAVLHSVSQLSQHAFSGKILIAIGERTAQTLAECGLTADLTAPPPFTSESLLADPRFQAQSVQQSALVCGVGGRRHLQEQLGTEGKVIHRIECYQRDKANVSPQVMVEFMRKYAIGGVIVSSCEIADAITEQLTTLGTSYGDTWVFFAFSERIGKRLRQRYQQVFVAESANQHALNQLMINWWEGQ